ncbi:MAG TPA: electron transfer flavoprotein subunit beta/FixA family protein [Desulfosalsimonadaceae bacterium]|nr:electron transfer flavoprotein subunit beta/FixA family protein [Desulfosalsimonadaceae bacterium]
MRILVCIKQVPEFEHIQITRAQQGAALLGEYPGYKINRFDEFAVEEAVQIKESREGASVDVLTVGPERAAEVLKRAIGMGADNGIHLLTDAGDWICPSVLASWIAAYAGTKAYDLVLCGSMSEDGMNGQVGPMLAAGLGIACATQAIAAKPAGDLGAIAVEREIENGSRELLELSLPALLALQTGANTPRYPSLSNLLRASKQEMEQVRAETLCSAPTGRDVLGFEIPGKSRAGRPLTGSAREKAGQLLALLREKALIQ